MPTPSLQYNNKGVIDNPLSAYQPSAEQQQLLSVADIDHETGDEILYRPFEEFNDMSILQRANLDQKDWLAWSPSPSQDPDEAWMFTGTSSATRNKIISTAAHLTQQVLYPKSFAQNDDDEEDEAAAEIMDIAIEYNCRRNNYEQTFLYGVISGLVNPVSYFKVDYAQQFQEILDGTSSNYTRKKVLDEVYSGFQHALIPLDEILLGNPYCFEMQKQPFVLNRRRITYGEAKGLHGDHENFDHVKPGVIAKLDSSSGLFYDVEDISDGLVQEITYSYRGRDTEFTTVNGIYLSNPNVEYLPMKHRDNKNRPKYNIVKYGAEPIDAMRFAYFKSLASKLSNDKELVDRMRQNAVDASTFATFPSIFTMGAGKLDKSVFIPATTVELGVDAKVAPASGIANPSYAYTAAREAENDMNKSSQDSQLSGVGGSQKTARESILLQQNAITNLGVIGRMITQGMVKPIGELMVDDIVRYQTVGEMMELSGGALGMKYRTLVLDNKIVNGQKKSFVIRFTDQWANKNLSDKEKEDREIELFEEQGDNKELHEVNPALWRRRQFMIVIDPDALKPMNDAFDRTFKTELYDRAINNPLIQQDPEKMANVTRDFLFEPTVKGESSKYLPKETKRVLQNIMPPKEGVTGKTIKKEAMSELKV